MDINMPEMNGITCTEIVTDKHPETRVLALTMHNEDLYLRKMIEAGAAGYILKNSDKEELLKAIDTITKGNHYLVKKLPFRLLMNLLKTMKFLKERKKFSSHQEK